MLGSGKTTYHLDRVVRETGEVVDDGLGIVCVNTKVNDGTDIAELMQLFMQTEVDNPKFPAFSERVNYIKYSEGGVGKMCEIMEEYAKEYAEERAEEYAREMLLNGADVEMVSKCIKELSRERILEIQKQVVANK